MSGYKIDRIALKMQFKGILGLKKQKQEKEMTKNERATYEFFCWLKKNKVDIRDPKSIDRRRDRLYHQPVLIWAARLNYISVAKILIHRGANVDITDNHGHTPLGIAVWNVYPEMVRLLLKYGANPNIKDKYGLLYPLLDAIGNHDKKTVGLLLKYGADPNAIDEHNNTALTNARWFCDGEMCEILISYGAKVND